MTAPIPCHCMVIERKSDGATMCRRCRDDWYACECPHVHTQACTRRVEGEPHYLSMPDPCPHISRLALIGARLRGDFDGLSGVDAMLEHVAECRGDVATGNDDEDHGTPDEPTTLDFAEWLGVLPGAGEADVPSRYQGSSEV